MWPVKKVFLDNTTYPQSTDTQDHYCIDIVSEKHLLSTILLKYLGLPVFTVINITILWTVSTNINLFITTPLVNETLGLLMNRQDDQNHD